MLRWLWERKLIAGHGDIDGLGGRELKRSPIRDHLTSAPRRVLGVARRAEAVVEDGLPLVADEPDSRLEQTVVVRIEISEHPDEPGGWRTYGESSVETRQRG